MKLIAARIGIRINVNKTKDFMSCILEAKKIDISVYINSSPKIHFTGSPSG